MSPPRPWMACLLGGTILLLAGVRTARAQPAEPALSDRPRIGLVLGGGGARGLAHVGVLQVLEEEHVPVDVIAGTSMGAIVGGLYANGLSAADLAAWVKQADWRELLDDSPRRALRNFRSKEEDFDLPTSLEIGIRPEGGVALPLAAITGQKLLSELRSLTLPTRAVNDFDRLPIPFRAVATDVETGDRVVLKAGVLADALRASMAVPGVFAPHAIDGRMLIDGFATSNLPIDVARAMGAEVVIAIDVSAPLRPANELRNPLDYSGQLVAILSRRDTQQQLKTLTPQDLFISCAGMKGGPMSFGQAQKFLAAGYAAADAIRANLRAYAVSPEEYKRWQQRFGHGKDGAHMVEFVRVKTDSKVNEEAIAQRIAVKPGDTLTPELLNESLMRVHALGEFEIVDYHLVEEAGRTGLEINAKRKSWGPNYLKLGFGVAGDLTREGRYDLFFSYRKTELNARGGELALNGRLGDNPRAKLEWFQPVDPARFWFIAPSVSWLRQEESALLDLGAGRRAQLGFLRTEEFAQLDSGITLGTWGQFRIGAGYGRVRYSDFSGEIVIIDASGDATTDPALISINAGNLFDSYTTARVSSELVVDTLDDAYFPRKGIYSRTTLRHEFAGQGFTDLSGLSYTAWTVGEFTFSPHVQFGVTVEDNSKLSRLPFSIGGLFNVSGILPGELYGKNVGSAAMVGYRRIGQLPNRFGDGLYLGGSAEVGSVWDDGGPRRNNLELGGSAFLGADTFLGPLYLGVGVAEQGRHVFFLYFGRPADWNK